ncbi:MAG TPA: hypothetical protein PKE31_17780 [Pseudomonadota bacterium]|nr:hypothetical protein [Pseudomonadota bacterium]
MNAYSYRLWAAGLVVGIVCLMSGCDKLWGGFAVPNQSGCGAEKCPPGNGPSDDLSVEAILDLTVGSSDVDLAGVDLAGADLAKLDLANPDMTPTYPTVIVVGKSGSIFRRNFTNNTWIPEVSAVPCAFRGVHGQSPSNIYVVGTGGKIYTRQGTTWSPVVLPAPLATLDYNSAFVGNTGNVYAGTESGPIAVRTTGGWAAASITRNVDGWSCPGGAVNGLFGSKTVTTVWATSGVADCAGTAGPKLISMLLQTTSDPTAFTAIAVMPNAGVTYEGLWGVDGPNLVAVGGTVADVLTGSSWTTALSGSLALHGVWGSSFTDAWIVGNNGMTLHGRGTLSVGSSWVSTTQGTEELRGVYGTGPNDVWAVGANGAVRHFDGNTWTPMNLGNGETLNAVWAGY